MVNGKCEEYFGEKSTFQSIFLLSRYALGIGIFLLPWAMKFGGIIAGPLIIAALIIINAYRSHVIRKLNSELLDLGAPCPAGCSDWWLLESSLGKVSKSRINAFLGILSTMQWISLLGHAAAFLAFAGTSFSQVYSGEESSTGKARIFTVLALGIVVIVHPVSQLIRNAIHVRFPDSTQMSSFFLLVFLPSVMVIIAVVMTLIHVISKYNDPVVRSDNYSAFAHLIPLLISGTLFVVGGTPDDVTGTLRNKKEETFCSISISLSEIIMIIVGIGFAIAVYLGFKNETCGSVTFQLPFNEPEYDAVRVITGIAALIFVSFRHQIEPKLAIRLAGPEVFCDIIFKIIFLCIAGGIAMAFPNFAGLACLFGSVTSIMFTFLFPFFCDLCYQITGGRNEEDDEDDEGKPLRPSSSSATEGEETPKSPKSIMRMIRDVIFLMLGFTGIIVGLITTIAYISHVSTQMQGMKPMKCIK